MAKIFISYRRADSEGHTGRIYDRLETHFGRNAVFIDIDTIPYGVDFVEYIDSAVTNCTVLLAIIGERWLNARYEDGPQKGKRCLEDLNDFVRVEIRTALAHDIPVVPVLVGRGIMPSASSLPEDLMMLVRQNAAEVRPGRDFHTQVSRLITRLEELLAEIEERRSTNFKLSDITFDDIAGYDEVKQELRKLVPPQDVPDHLYHNIIPRGLLLHGPAGTGKRLFANAVANKMNAKIYIASGPELVDVPLGEEEHKLRKFFAEARRNAPSVLVLNEFDAIASVRSVRLNEERPDDNFLANIICNEMDEFGPNVPVLLVGITNRIDLIDSNLLNPSRV
jgi:SpoVK/Ycf46/Vps4 family AAA+-type ATPase